MERPALILRFRWRTTWALLMVLATVIWAATVGAQPAKKVVFKKGQIQYKVGGRSFAVPLSTLPDSGTLQTEVPLGENKPVSALGLDYEDSTGDHHVTISVFNLSGPGKYGKANIYHFDLRAVWEYTRNRDDCTFVFTRLDASGVEGTATCTAAGAKAPFTDMQFTASPG